MKTDDVWGRSGKGPLVYHRLVGREGAKQRAACGRTYEIRWAYRESQGLRLERCPKCEAAP